jgi:di/tricarboxylate transporter
VAALVPGIVSLLVIPLLLYVIYPPTVKSSPDAPKLAKENLAKMGPMSKNEKIMAGTLLVTVSKTHVSLAALVLFPSIFLTMSLG